MPNRIRNGVSTLHKCADCLCDIVHKFPLAPDDARIPPAVATAIRALVTACDAVGFAADTFLEVNGAGTPANPE
jgi:hypothetical protein